MVLDSPGGTAKLHPEIYRNAEAAEWTLEKRGEAPNPAGWVPFRYKHAGQSQNWRTGRYDPAAFAGPADARARIQLSLGLAWGAFEVVEQADDLTWEKRRRANLDPKRALRA